MGIESNKEAYQTMKNSIGSMENRMREIYNKGYKDGIKEGINQEMQKKAGAIDIRAREGYCVDGVLYLPCVLYLPYRDIKKSLDSIKNVEVWDNEPQTERDGE